MTGRTTVAIVGAGASGLTLAALLHRRGVDFVVLEARSRSYVEERQPFRRQLARARLERLFDSPPAAAAFADLMAGIR